MREVEMESEEPYERIIISETSLPSLSRRSLDIPVEETESVIEEYIEEPRFKLRKKLGEGSYGDVYLALDVSRGELVALKLYKSSEYKSYKQEKAAYEILSKTPNCDPYVVCMYDSGRFQGKYFISQELMSGDVTDFTGNSNMDKLIEYKVTDPLALLLIFLQMAEGMRHIHESGMAHLDVKPQNILYKTSLDPSLYAGFFNNPEIIRGDVCFKFGDPGFACTTMEQMFATHIIEDKEDEINFSSCKRGEEYRRSGKVSSLGDVDLCDFTGTPIFMAPEFYSARLRGMTPRQRAAGIRFYQANDIWSLGLTFRAIIKGRANITNLGYATSQDGIPEMKFNSGNPTLDHKIEHLINNMMIVYDFEGRQSATDIVSYISEVVNDYFRSAPPSTTFPTLDPAPTPRSPPTLEEVERILMEPLALPRPTLEEVIRIETTPSTRIRRLSSAGRSGVRPRKRRGVRIERAPISTESQRMRRLLPIRDSLSQRRILSSREFTDPILDVDYSSTEPSEEEEVNIFLSF